MANVRRLTAACLASVVAITAAQAQDVVMRRPLPAKSVQSVPSECGKGVGTGFYDDPGCTTVTTPGPPPTDNPWTPQWRVGEWTGQSACGVESVISRKVDCVQYRPNAEGDETCHPDEDYPDNCSYGRNHRIPEQYCLANPDAGPKPPTSYKGTSAGCAYDYSYGEWGDWDSTCSYSARRTRTATCSLDGAEVDMVFCTSGIGEEEGRPELEEYRTDLSSCALRWKYVYQGYEGYGDPFVDGRLTPQEIASGLHGEGTNTYCRQDGCGKMTGYRYFPAHCYMTGPGGQERPAPLPGQEGFPQVPGFDPDDASARTGGWAGDYTCIARGLPRPAPLRNEVATLSCNAYGSHGVPTRTETQETLDGTGKVCSGTLLGSYKMAYGQTDNEQAKQFCASKGAACCTWHGDQQERASDGHVRYWTIEAHAGTAWADADEDNSTFSLRAMIDGSATGFGKPVPDAFVGYVGGGVPVDQVDAVQSCQTSVPLPPPPELPEQPPVVQPTPPTPPDRPHVDEDGIYYSPCRKTSGGGNFACGEGAFGLEYSGTRIPFPEEFCSGDVVAGAYWTSSGQQVGPSQQFFMSPGWTTKPPKRDVAGAQCVVHYKQGYSHRPEGDAWVSIYFNGPAKDGRPSQLDYMGPKP